MEKDSTLNRLKQIFEQVIPAKDKPTKLPHLEFVSGFIFCFLGDTKTSSLEAIRRFMMNTFDVSISKSAFWERLARNRLKNILRETLADLIKKMPSLSLAGESILSKLKVTSILLIDSSSISLWDGAQESYPGTRTNAGIKWHACFNLLSGKMEWFSISSTSVHDRKCFPKVDWLKGKLIIFDLGYWDYSLFNEIALAEGRFLSRVKTNAVISISEIVKGISRELIGEKLSSIHLKKRRGSIIEFYGDVGCKKPKRHRIIGFWNKADKKYHWYVTNLEVSASAIYSLYRIRWQIELIFKGCKRSLNLDEKMTSNNSNIIESLILSSIIASVAMHIIYNESIKELTGRQKLAVSFQRLSHVVVLLALDFIKYLTLADYFKNISRKIRLFSHEIYEKNHAHRRTTLQILADDLGCG